MDRTVPGTGSGVSAALAPAVERALGWAGTGLQALLLSGSHATGDAVWVALDGRPVTLSDLDLYAVMRDDDACAAASARAAADRPGLARESLAWGVAAPLEVAFVTLEGLARMPARPGTVELSRSCRVLAGDPDVCARLPRWEPADVSAEERLLLLENRAFELLWAAAAPPDGLGALRARHAVLKAALDLASARTLARGELPLAIAERVERAKSCGLPPGLPSWLERAWDGVPLLWEEAIAWRGGRALALPAEQARVEWRAAVRGWSAAWWAEGEGRSLPRDPWERALRVAARASLARRLRRSLSFRARTGETPGAGERLRHCLAGTPQDRIHGTAAVLVLAAAQSPNEPRLSAGALRALHRLGVTHAGEFGDARLGALRAWDRQLHDGLRTAVES